MIRFLRIPERELEQKRKREALDRSLNEFRASIHQKSKPQNLLREHPKLLLAAVLGSASLAKIIFGKKGAGLKKLVSFLAGSGLKAVAPVALYFLKSSFKKSR